MNGIRVDSTLIGVKPYYPVINGKMIPIIELPFCISDKANRPMCTYNISKNIETPFKNKQKIITVLSHPFNICKDFQLTSCYYDVLNNADKYGYNVIAITDFLHKCGIYL